MKAKELAEILLKYPDYDVEFDICTSMPTYDRPYPTYQSYKICGVDGAADVSKVLVVDVEEVD